MTTLRQLHAALEADQPLADYRRAAKAAYHATLQAADGLWDEARAEFPSVHDLTDVAGLTAWEYFDRLGEKGLNAWRAQLKTWLASLPKAERERLLETEVLS